MAKSYCCPAQWLDETAASLNSERSADLLVDLENFEIPVEVTHIRERTPFPPSAGALLTFFGKEAVPDGRYALSIGSGEPPIRKLRSALSKNIKSATTAEDIDIAIGDWRVSGITSGAQSILSNEEDAEILLIRIASAVKAKRRKLRDIKATQAIIAIIVLDRDIKRLIEMADQNPQLFSRIVYGRDMGSSNLDILVLLGAVALDVHPPVPNWYALVPTSSSFFAGFELNLPQLKIPLSNIQLPDIELPEARSLIFATRTTVRAVQSQATTG